MKKSKKIKKEVLDFNAVFLEEADGGFAVSVPSLPGCFSQGYTLGGIEKCSRSHGALFRK